MIMKNIVEKKYTKKYIKEIRTLLPFYGKEERIFLNTIKRNVSSFCRTLEKCDMNDIYEEFGFPQEAVFNYLSVIESESLYDALKKSKIMRRTISIVCIILLMASISFIIFELNAYIKFKNAEVFSIESEIIRIE